MSKKLTEYAKIVSVSDSEDRDATNSKFGLINQVNYPCLNPKLVSITDVKSNDYNPNKVATPEMQLLIHSIEEDGLTMPIVTCYDPERKKYIIVDGFHRFLALRDHFRVKVIPIVVIDREINDRMAATVRHNRARGVHQVDLQAELVKSLTLKGWENEEIAKHLGMEYEEILRLKQSVGIAKMIKYKEYGQAWEIVDE